MNRKSLLFLNPDGAGGGVATPVAPSTPTQGVAPPAPPPAPPTRGVPSLFEQLNRAQAAQPPVPQAPVATPQAVPPVVPPVVPAVPPVAPQAATPAVPPVVPPVTPPVVPAKQEVPPLVPSKAPVDPAAEMTRLATEAVASALASGNHQKARALFAALVDDPAQAAAATATTPVDERKAVGDEVRRELLSRMDLKTPKIVNNQVALDARGQVIYEDPDLDDTEMKFVIEREVDNRLLAKKVETLTKQMQEREQSDKAERQAREAEVREAHVATRVKEIVSQHVPELVVSREGQRGIPMFLWERVMAQSDKLLSNPATINQDPVALVVQAGKMVLDLARQEYEMQKILFGDAPQQAPAVPATNGNPQAVPPVPPSVGAGYGAVPNATPAVQASKTSSPQPFGQRPRVPELWTQLQATGAITPQ